MSSTPPEGAPPVSGDPSVAPEEPGGEEARTARARLNAGAVVPALVSSAGAVAVALVLGALVILSSGDNPFTAYRALFRGAFGDTNGLSETLVAASPLILAGLGFAVAF